MNPKIAVIDVGSNSIKSLVAELDSNQKFKVLHENTLQVRIGGGASGSLPTLSEDALRSGTNAVLELFKECQPFDPDIFKIVATSAVREAANGSRFTQLILENVKVPLSILSGDEEARLIGLGVLEDPAIRSDRRPTAIADLGGGSLELIHIAADLSLVSNISLKLGAVRLVEQFVNDPRKPLLSEEEKNLRNFVHNQVAQSGFPFGQRLVGTGGIVTVWRAIDAASIGFDDVQGVPPELTRDDLRSLYQRINEMEWSKRISIPGLPPERADILPTGLIVMDTLMKIANTETITHSLYNLRYGVAAEFLCKS